VTIVLRASRVRIMVNAVSAASMAIIAAAMYAA
jgi:hypothetical protein